MWVYGDNYLFDNRMVVGDMYWKVFFYGYDGFVLEKKIYGLEPNIEHRTYRLKSYKRDGEILHSVERLFRMVTAFIVDKQHIAYYEEI